jgi:hypothetical protein
MLMQLLWISICLGYLPGNTGIKDKDNIGDGLFNDFGNKNWSALMLMQLFWICIFALLGLCHACLRLTQSALHHCSPTHPTHCHPSVPTPGRAGSKMVHF